MNVHPHPALAELRADFPAYLVCEVVNVATGLPAFYTATRRAVRGPGEAFHRAGSLCALRQWLTAQPAEGKSS